MNINLQKLFNRFYYGPEIWTTPEVYYGKSNKLLNLMLQYNIKSIFDAGCGPRHWIADNKFLEHGIVYTGGDIAQANVQHCNKQWPELDIRLHDMTTDPLPEVDLIFSSDVVIHLNNADKLNFLKNFLDSKSTYLLVTHSGDVPHVEENKDFEYTDQFPFQPVNWFLAPWNFPTELDCLTDDPPIGQKRMCLWSREQIQEAVSNL